MNKSISVVYLVGLLACASLSAADPTTPPDFKGKWNLTRKGSSIGLTFYARGSDNPLAGEGPFDLAKYDASLTETGSALEISNYVSSAGGEGDRFTLEGGEIGKSRSCT